eukprot:scaffold160510_cov37-Prasinocladus_malaysianus.AAC.1
MACSRCRGPVSVFPQYHQHHQQSDTRTSSDTRWYSYDFASFPQQNLHSHGTRTRKMRYAVPAAGTVPARISLIWMHGYRT